MLFDTIQKDIKTAMFEKNNVKRDCLRAIISEIKNQTVNAGKEITEDICLKVLQKSVKQHNDSIESFKLGKREDLALKEMEELSYLEIYLPKMLSEENIQTIILKIISDNKIEEVKKNMGQIMKFLNQHPDSKLIDRKIASHYLNVLLK